MSTPVDGGSPSDELIEVGQVSSPHEAVLVVGLLRDSGIEALSDAVNASSAFGGLPFESGHRIFAPVGSAAKAREILERNPRFQPPAE